MLAEWFTIKVRKSLSFIGIACLLVFFPALALTACFHLNIDCSGIAIACSHTLPTPTANVPVVIATAQAITRGKPLLNDSLSQPDSTWANRPGKCFFQKGSYTVEYNRTDQNAGPSFGCDAQNTNFGDVGVQMDVTLISGDNAGILFRADEYFSQMYFFDINAQKQAELYLFGPGSGEQTILLLPTFNKAIQGVGRKNTLLLIARGNDFLLFVNGTFVGEAHDGTTLSGRVGMGVTDRTHHAQATFSNVVVYSV